MAIFWLEQKVSDVPSQDDWLSAGELLRLNGMRFAKRRVDWRLGRWTAKLAVVALAKLSVQPDLSKIEIRSAPSGAPRVIIEGNPAPVTVSISHRAGVAICAIGEPGVALGCDLEIVEPHSDAFVDDYFTPDEKLLLARTPLDERSSLLTTLWSAKESALKALQEGLRLDTRQVTITSIDFPADPDVGQRQPCETLLDDSRSWRPFNIRCPNDEVFDGWWQRTHEFVRTIVANPPSPPPVFLQASRRVSNPKDEATSVFPYTHLQSLGSEPLI